MDAKTYLEKKQRVVEDARAKLSRLDSYIEMITMSRDNNAHDLAQKEASLEKIQEIVTEIERLHRVIEESQNKVASAIEEDRKLTMDEKIEITFIEECQKEITDLEKQATKVYYNR